MNGIFPATTDDERVSREDQNEDRKRQDEMIGDKLSDLFSRT